VSCMRKRPAGFEGGSLRAPFMFGGKKLNKCFTIDHSPIAYLHDANCKADFIGYEDYIQLRLRRYMRLSSVLDSPKPQRPPAAPSVSPSRSPAIETRATPPALVPSPPSAHPTSGAPSPILGFAEQRHDGQ
jgi:hypothetical protein